MSRQSASVMELISVRHLDGRKQRIYDHPRKKSRNSLNTDGLAAVDQTADGVPSSSCGIHCIPRRNRSQSGAGLTSPNKAALSRHHRIQLKCENVIFSYPVER